MNESSSVAVATATSRIGLPSWGLIGVSGPDARAFLHGQFSNDLLNLPPDQAQWTAYCSPKGRMLAGFVVWTQGDDDFRLVCANSLIPALLKRLRMFVLRAKVAIVDMSRTHRIEGILAPGDAGQDMRVVHDAGTTIVNLAPAGPLLRALAISPALADTPTEADESAWARLMIRAGEVWITEATADQFVPQMVNFDAIGGINFKKGCYPGQEIVARAHYRGAVKRRMFRAFVDGSASPGQALFSAGANAQECGMIANAVAGESGGSEVLAVLPMQIRADSVVHLGEASGPILSFADLPYAFPEAA